MVDQPLLSDLCGICHAEIPKYRCPACSIRSCSLPCVRVHKQRGCSGKLDPTTFVKKSQLATSSALDHDYNFITGIERARDRAENRLMGRDIETAQARPNALSRKVFLDRLRQTGVNVEYGPLGLTRQKLNRTRLAKSKRILWTIEWIHEDDTTTIREIWDDKPISEEYERVHTQRAGQSARSKRKLDEVSTAAEMTSNLRAITQKSTSEQTAARTTTQDGQSPAIQDCALQMSQAHGQDLHGDELPANSQVEEDIPDLSAINRDQGGNHEEKDFDSLMASNTGEPVASEHVLACEDAECSQADESSTSARMPGSPDRLGLYYYLVKPRTGSNQKVLVPVPPVGTLYNVLKGHTVLEFPTIKVSRCGANDLPAVYIVEKQYLEQAKRDADNV